MHPFGMHPGTGLRLALCKKIINRHGGTIYAKSEVIKGAVFYMTLPISLVIKTSKVLI